jgi:ABC-type transport system substrate-binding protein
VRPRVKTLVFRPIPDDAVRVAALQNGEVDVAVNIPPHMANIIANHPKLFLTTAPSVRTIQLMYYTHQYDAQHKLVGPYPGPTADKRVRWAMNYAVDVDDIIKNVLDGKAQRVGLMLTDRHFGFDPAIKPIKQDLAKSKQLLTEAGFPGGPRDHSQLAPGALRARQGSGRGYRGAADQGGHPHHRAHPRVGALLREPRVQPQDAAGVAHRVGHGHV